MLMLKCLHCFDLLPPTRSVDFASLQLCSFLLWCLKAREVAAAADSVSRVGPWAEVEAVCQTDPFSRVGFISGFHTMVLC